MTMKKLLGTLLGLAVLALGPRASGLPGPAHRPPPPPESNRVPTNDSKGRFPRWLPQAVLGAQLNPSTHLVENTLANARIVVDSQNVVHIVGTRTDSNGG